MTNPTSTPRRLADPGERAEAPAVPTGVEYHRVLAGDQPRIGRGVLAIMLLLAGLVVFPTVIGRAVAVIDVQLGNTPPILGGTDYTPLYHAATMASLALLLPWGMLIHRWLYGVPGASLHSVRSVFRFDLFGRALLVLGPVWLVVLLLFNLLAGPGLPPGAEIPWSSTDLILFFLATLLLTPLQAAGEEYGVRGLIFRVVGSWTRGPRAGLIAGVVVTTGLFTAIHGATDLYIIVWYLALWASLAVITWRTGGLEVAVVLHAILNTVSFLLAAALGSDLGAALQDRSAGVGSPYLLIPAAAAIAIAAAVWWRTRRTGPARTPSPAAHPHPVGNR